MHNEREYLTALKAAWETGERVRIANNRTTWTDEEFDAAAQELKRRLLGEEV